MNLPLAERMRPKKLDHIVGQQHLIGQGKSLRMLIDSGNLHSIIFWGPPGVGKTTLARILAQESHLSFEQLSAISSGVKELRAVIESAQREGTKVLFIDEIHRFNKSQQDALLGAVEQGIIILIGATTENPSFEVNAALLSRCHVYTLNSLSAEDLIALCHQTLTQDEFLARETITIKEYDALIYFAGGDARKLLNVLELVISGLSNPKIIDNKTVELVIQSNIARYDKSGEQHYDIISAFIKSIRGSDVNASLYWLARMIVAGEDPKFIARRLVILAAEDIGLANPNALLLANATFDAVTTIGYPECRIILSECVIYLASATKSNAAYVAINKAMDLAEKTNHLSVPLHLRNTPTQLMKNMGYGMAYKYPHDYENGIVQQEYLPKEIAHIKFYEIAVSKNKSNLA